MVSVTSVVYGSRNGKWEVGNNRDFKVFRYPEFQLLTIVIVYIMYKEGITVTT